MFTNPDEYYNMDSVEQDYVRAINDAANRGDNDLANELSAGLSEYQRSYKR